jgi:hypothetical protein
MKMGLFENAFANPETMGLLAAAAQGLQMSGPSRVPVSTGQVLGSMLGGGLQGYQGALRAQQEAEERKMMADHRKAQMSQIQRKIDTETAQQAAIGRLRAKMESDPTYKPTSADMFEIDPESALKSMTSTADFGLEPKIGIHPTTGKPGYFVQDNRSGTKWLDAGVPDNLKYIPGNEYTPAQTFNPRGGEVAPARPFAAQSSNAAPASPTAAALGMPAGVPASAEVAPAVDQLAPWASLRSPKEQDQMRARVYEQDNKRLDDLRAQVTQGRAAMRDLERFGELNREQATGGLLDRANLWTFDPEKREMESIQARLAPMQRVPGSGTTSDRDIALYLQSLPGVDKDGNVNRNIREQFAEQLRNAEEQLAFRERYLTEKGHLVGVDEAFQRMKGGGKDGGKPPTAPLANPNGSWTQINESVAGTQPARDSERLAILQEELSRETNPANRAALEREIGRTQGAKSAPQTAQKTWKEFGYANQQAAVRDAQNAIMRNPSAKAEIIRRLEAAGITNHGIR